MAATVLAVLHLATSSRGPGAGNGLVGAVAAVSPGLGDVFIGSLALTRLRRTGRMNVRPPGHGLRAATARRAP